MSGRRSCGSERKSVGGALGKLSDKERSTAIAMRRKKLFQAKSPYSALNPRPLPSAEEILSSYDYDPELFMFFFKPSGKTKRRRAGTIVQGYIRLSVNGKSWPVHRLIWKLCTGSDPVGLIDHINGVRYDNRIQNLRDVTAQANNLNRHGDLNRRLEADNRLIDRDRRLAERENRERDQMAMLQAKYAAMRQGQAHKKANAEAKVT